MEHLINVRGASAFGVSSFGDEGLCRAVLQRAARRLGGRLNLEASEFGRAADGTGPLPACGTQVYASKAARGSIAEFMGFCEVEREQANGNLTPGLWLVGCGSCGGAGRGAARAASCGSWSLVPCLDADPPWRARAS